MTTVARPDLSLVFPVFDEEDNIGQLLEQVLEIAPRLALDFEIVIVDDGSRDASAEVVEAIRNGEPRIRLLRHESNRGYGAALRAGLREARGNLVFFSDADLQFDLDELSTLLHHADEFDIVAGYRQPRRDPWGRRLLAASWGWLVDMLFDVRVRDIDCAFKIFPRSLFDEIEMSSMGALIDAEILARARRLGYTIGQVGVHHYPRTAGEQSGATLRVILRAFKELFVLSRHIRKTSRKV